MKKNKMLRLASALLVLVMLTTSIIGGTFAKYVTSDTANDTARVAKWGVKIDVTSDLFATSYTMSADSTTVTVKTSEDDEKLVAPGTTGKGLAVKNSADSEPEVSYNMTIKLDDNAKMPKLTYTPKNGSKTTYEPVVFNVYNGEEKLNTNSLTLTELKALFNGTKVIYKYDVATKQYTVDKNLDGNFTDATATGTEPNIKVEWVWAFDAGTAATDAQKNLTDQLDTILGDMAAGTTEFNNLPDTIGSLSTTNGDNNTGVSLTWTVTATQID